MNPRYYQQDQKSPRERKLAELAGVIGLSNSLQGPQLEQRAASEREHQNRVMAALQLLGLSQQQQDASATQGFRQQELQQRGDIASNEQQVQRDRAAAEAAQHKQALAATLFAHASGMPGTDLRGALDIGGLMSPEMGAKAEALQQQQRQQAIQTIYPQLKSVTDPKAREAFGHAQLAKYPGAYEEAMSLAFPAPVAAPQSVANPAAAMFSSPTETPLLDVNSREGIRRNPVLEFLHRLLTRKPGTDPVFPPGVEIDPTMFGGPN